MTEMPDWKKLRRLTHVIADQQAVSPHGVAWLPDVQHEALTLGIANSKQEVGELLKAAIAENRIREGRIPGFFHLTPSEAELERK